MRRYLTILLLLAVVVVSAACTRVGFFTSPLSPLSPLSPPTVGVTAQATSTPPIFPTIPSILWTPAPTWTPVPPPPTPRPRPIPPLPPEAVVPDRWPSLPTDLYFIRSDTLWRWPREGGPPQRVLDGLTNYRLTPDGRYVLFVHFLRSGPKAGVLDRVTGEVVLIPKAGDSWVMSPLPGRPACDITPDGRYVIYLAWGVSPATGERAPGLAYPAVRPHPGGPRDGTIFAVEVPNPNREYELGYCAAYFGPERELWCDGFVLSPDGTKVAFSDGRGVWLANVPGGRPRLLAEHESPESFCGVWRVANWSPDGRHLLLNVGCFEGGYSALMDVDTGKIEGVSHTWGYVDVDIQIVWGQNSAGLLVNYINFMMKEAQLRWVPVDDLSHEMTVISATWPAEVWPVAPREMPDGRIAFVNQQCVDGRGARPGIYTIRRDGTGLTFAVPLPPAPCYESEYPESMLYGTYVFWSPDGKAFLYFSEGRPFLLGWMDGSALWDVREMLKDAHNFQWQLPHAGY